MIKKNKTKQNSSGGCFSFFLNMIFHHSGVSQWMPLLIQYTINSPSLLQIQSLTQFKMLESFNSRHFQSNRVCMPGCCKPIQVSWSQVLCRPVLFHSGAVWWNRVCGVAGFDKAIIYIISPLWIQCEHKQHFFFFLQEALQRQKEHRNKTFPSWTVEKWTPEGRKKRQSPHQYFRDGFSFSFFFFFAAFPVCISKTTPADLPDKRVCVVTGSLN